MPKKTDLMEENEFLSEETMEGECVVLQDETGRMLTEEEAVLEEERLLMKIDNFFLANPSFPQMEAEEEEEDEEDTLVTLNKEGEIIKEVTTVLKQKPRRILSAATNRAGNLQLKHPDNSQIKF